jgi:hypothetical protein
MTSFEELFPVAQRALTQARRAEREELRDALERAGVVRVFGEAGVGKTTLLATAVRRQPVIAVDLHQVSGPGDVAWLIARGLARHTVGALRVSELEGPARLRSPVARRALIDLQNRLGMQLTDIALADGPVDKDSDDLLAAAMEAIERVVMDDMPLTAWIDQVESPGLTPRHPVSARALLWQFRSIRQRSSSLQIVASGRAAAQRLVDDEDGALHGDGIMVRIDRPTDEVWQQVAADLARVAGGRGVPARIVVELCALTERHPGTMLLALCERASRESGHRAAEPLIAELANRDDGHTARAAEHARTLHRLGGQVLVEIAHGRKPYRQPGLGSRPQEINRALQRLHAAGLLTNQGHGAWSVTNPLLAIRIRALARGGAAAADVSEGDEPGLPAIER